MAPPTLLILLLLTSSSFANSAFTSDHYSDALTKSILFFEGQRSGKLPATQRLKWRADSALHDGSSANVPSQNHQNTLLFPVTVPHACRFSVFRWI